MTCQRFGCVCVLLCLVSIAGGSEHADQTAEIQAAIALVDAELRTPAAERQRQEYADAVASTMPAERAAWAARAHQAVGDYVGMITAADPALGVAVGTTCAVAVVVDPPRADRLGTCVVGTLRFRLISGQADGFALAAEDARSGILGTIAADALGQLRELVLNDPRDLAAHLLVVALQRR